MNGMTLPLSGALALSTGIAALVTAPGASGAPTTAMACDEICVSWCPPNLEQACASFTCPWQDASCSTAGCGTNYTLSCNSKPAE
jgi:hypothetical protein